MILGLKDQLKRDEGLRLIAYPDPISYLATTGKGSGEPYTIGYGHASSDVYPGLVWTEAQADAALDDDIQHAIALLDAHIPWWRSMSEPRQMVLANMCYNMGFGDGAHGLSSFRNTLAKMKSGDYAGAADGMLSSNWAKQTKKRAQRLAIIMRTGTNP